MNVDKTISVNPFLSNQEDKKNEVFGTSFRNKQKGKNELLKSNSIFAGSLNMMKQDTIAAKQVEARRKAMKQIMDTFAADGKTDETLQEHTDSIEEQKALHIEATLKLDEAAKKEESLKEEYNITPDSQEYKDLELLRKQRDILSGESKEQLTPEEKDRLANMGPVTEYQKDALENDEIKSEYTKQLRDSKSKIVSDLYTINLTKEARLKSAPMLDAEKEAEKILEEASKEVIGMLLDEAKDHIDEKTEEAKEKEAKEEEKKKEEEKRTNVDKQSDSQTESANKAMSVIQDVDTAAKKVEEELKKQIKKIPPEDIAGINIDKKA